MAHSGHSSRKKTPWENATDMTPTQKFIHIHHKAHYKQRHPTLLEAGEAEMINSYHPLVCPYCAATSFVRDGLDNNRIQRYRCRMCRQRFRPTTNTIFDSRKIPISEWIEYCTNIFRYVSLSADSWNNKNAFSTSKYWLEKLFLCLQDSQKDVILSGTVWLDETFYSVLMRDRERNEEGNLLRGLSRNQICIGVATDKEHTICFVEGLGKPSTKKSYEAFKGHIAPGSTLIHDKESAHGKLVKELNLKSIDYASGETKNLKDSDNPLEPVNRVHALLKRFLYAHSGFNRDELQGYVNLFAFVSNPPTDSLEKVEKIMKMAFENPKKLRYRDQFLDK